MRIPGLNVRGALVLALAGSAACARSSPIVGAPEAAGGPSIWSVDLVAVKRGEYRRYLEFLRLNWGRARHTARERGLIADFRAVVDTTAGATWHVLLMTEYPDSAAYDRREQIFRPILDAQGRTLIDGRGTRELTDSIDYRVYQNVPGAP